MAAVLFPLPDRDFDVTEVAVPWKLLVEAGHEVVFATEAGATPACDPLLITGVVFGKLGARAEPIAFYRELEQAASFAAPRRYRPLYPRVLDARVGQFVFEYANREMSEIELWSEFPTDKEVAAGVIDVKAFRVETPEEVADRVRLALKHIPAARLWLVPDCGLWETPRWVGISKLRSMVEAARMIRRELGIA